jgi:uncharacterized protein (DUF58 family)
MIRPTRRLVGAALAGFPLALLPVFAPALWGVWVGYIGLVVLAAGLDIALGLGRSELRSEIDVPEVAYLGDELAWPVELEARDWPHATRVEVTVAIDGPAVDPEIARASLEEGEARVELPIEPERRGRLECAELYLRWTGRMGLTWREERRPVERGCDLVPNIAAVRRAAMRFRTHHTMMTGMKRRDYIGDGTEFESLRRFVPGLDTRDIDWRASARHRKLLCRENRSERNHRVVLAFDTGHLMSESIEGLPKIDHAINAGLMMAYLSLQMGDRVGLFAFDDEVRTYSEPRAGVRQVQRLMLGSSRFDYSTAETNYTLAMTELARRLRRRAVVVVLTDFTDTVGAELMVENLGWLARRHLVVFVSIRDPWLRERVEARPDDMSEVGASVIAGQLSHDRRLVLERLRRRGIFCVDGAPDQISVELINQYLEIHRRELV